MDTDNQIRLICPIKKRRNFIEFDIIVLLDTYRLRYYFFRPNDYKNHASLYFSYIYIYITYISTTEFCYTDI